MVAYNYLYTNYITNVYGKRAFRLESYTHTYIIRTVH